MNRYSLTGQRLAGIFLLGCVLLNYPILYLFNTRGEVFGIPVLYAFLFGAWLVLVGLMAWMIERRKD
ncbi:MAG TPA: hypothetical protein PLX20_15725 [Rhodocyclaceae bacterium]|nr:hypothetical protein [Rhodocyclaceae bacterium]HMV54070.1 hypothetical protein [Rhodocyclaceae bacterium]HNA03030.1 hypothetical protein [Rhodocyclaceae bacterium]HNB77834.1 hypothetical protein [Rhodocyclaceae bacterium]HNC61514.1 hypothetical protein [Rhodocyclaceae bacterium]